MNRVRIGVVGLGFGEFHVRTLANMTEFHLTAVADFDSGRRASVASRYNCRPFSDADEMLRETELDAISVCVSPHFRKGVLESAVEHNVAMFIEKPWAANPAHARELEQLCGKTSAPVMTGFSFRFHPVVRKSMELVRHECGSVQLGNGSYVFDWLPPADSWLWDPENGGGFFNENSCHIIDVVCALAGRPVELFAYGLRQANCPSEAAAAVLIRFVNDSVVTLTLGGIGAGAVPQFPWLDFTTEDGSLELVGENHVWTIVKWTRHGDRDVKQMSASPEQLGRTRYTDALEHFAACIRECKTPETTIADGVLAVQVADAMRKSIRSGKPVSIPEDSQE